jgi:hypothetical protein
MQAVLVLHPASARVLFHHVTDTSILDSLACTEVYSSTSTGIGTNEQNADDSATQRDNDAKPNKGLLMIQINTIASLLSVIIQQIQVLQANSKHTRDGADLLDASTEVGTESISSSQSPDYIRLEAIQCDQTHIWVSL